MYPNTTARYRDELEIITVNNSDVIKVFRNL